MPSAVAEAMQLALAGFWPAPRRLVLSDWSDANFYLSRENSADPGRWRCLPYQRAVLDAVTDPNVEQITWMKSARVGATKCLDIAVAYHIAEDPCPILVFQPTLEDARRYSKREIAPMLRDCEILLDRVRDARSRESGNTIQDKDFNGGSLELLGANSPAGFRSRTIRLLIFDEVDGYPPSAGEEGDPISLGIRRTETFWNRKILAVSTPASEPSRIEALYLEGDQRRYYVPCPHCGHSDVLVPPDGDHAEGGHWMWWPEGEPARACFFCSKCGAEIGHEHKRDMVTAGEWRAGAEFKGHASFFIWSAYSFSANATWAQIAKEHDKAHRSGNDEEVAVVDNTLYGRPRRIRGDAPPWEALYRRRERYAGVPRGVLVLTMGIDVQKDRLECEVDGWGANRESWVIDKVTIPAKDTANESDSCWAAADALLFREWDCDDGQRRMIAKCGIDSGYNTSAVYVWAHRHPAVVMACKGMGEDKIGVAMSLVGTAIPTVLKATGRLAQRRGLYWPVRVGLAKSELYAWLRLEPPLNPGEPYPPGFRHFSEALDEEYFRQLTAEQLVTHRNRLGRTVLEWVLLTGRQNHALDAAIYSRAAAFVHGVDRITTAAIAEAEAAPVPRPPPASSPLARQPRDDFKRPQGGPRPWMGKRKSIWGNRR